MAASTASANLERYSSYSRERTYKHTLLRERIYNYITWTHTHL